MGRVGKPAALVARDVVLRVYEKLPKPFLLNVNIPNKPYAELKKICATRSWTCATNRKRLFAKRIRLIGKFSGSGRQAPFGMQEKAPIFMRSGADMCR